MQVPKDQVLPARVLYEDKDFMTLEVGKHDEVVFHLDDDTQQNRFLTLIFIHNTEEGFTTWLPWEDEDAGY